MDAYYDYIRTRGFVPTEGETHPEQAAWWVAFCQTHGAHWRSVAEVGFNGGLSAVLTLAALPHVHMTSYDLGEHTWVPRAQECVQRMFPGRHTLVLGDSRETLPDADATHMLEALFIDGGHFGDVPYLDLKHARRLVKPDGFIIMDDYCPTFGGDVVRAWDRAVAEKLIEPIGAPHRVGEFGWVVGRPLHI